MIQFHTFKDMYHKQKKSKNYFFQITCIIYWVKKYNHGQSELIYLSALQRNCKITPIGLMTQSYYKLLYNITKRKKISNIHKTESVSQSGTQNKISVERDDFNILLKCYHKYLIKVSFLMSSKIPDNDKNMKIIFSKCYFKE